MQDLTPKLRKLAKSTYWQTVFASSKILYGVKVFENSTEFTEIQIDFINWLSYYNNLNIYLEDGTLPEWAYAKDLYIDAFMYHMKKKGKKEKKTIQFDSKADKKNDNFSKEGKITLPGLKVVFKGKE